MKAIINGKQAERLKEVCEKHKVNLPIAELCQYMAGKEGKVLTVGLSVLWNRDRKYPFVLSFTELLDWLPKEVKFYYRVGETYFESLYISWITGNGWHCAYGDSNFLKKELIDALFELFIWTIENGYYKGVE